GTPLQLSNQYRKYSKSSRLPSGQYPLKASVSKLAYFCDKSPSVKGAAAEQRGAETREVALKNTRIYIYAHTQSRLDSVRHYNGPTIALGSG
ncbi:hypothetical protein GWI33_002373, partial [Rhynchophorus ferrugineus]